MTTLEWILAGVVFCQAVGLQMYVIETRKLLSSLGRALWGQRALRAENERLNRAHKFGPFLATIEFEPGIEGRWCSGCGEELKAPHDYQACTKAQRAQFEEESYND